jgi:hypothetical protein
VHAGFFDVLHDPGDVRVLAIRQRIDIELVGVLEEAIEQHRRVGIAASAVSTNASSASSS